MTGKSAVNDERDTATALIEHIYEYADIMGLTVQKEVNDAFAKICNKVSAETTAKPEVKKNNFIISKSSQKKPEASTKQEHEKDDDKKLIITKTEIKLEPRAIASIKNTQDKQQDVLKQQKPSLKHSQVATNNHQDEQTPPTLNILPKESTVVEEAKIDPIETKLNQSVFKKADSLKVAEQPVSTKDVTNNTEAKVVNQPASQKVVNEVISDIEYGTLKRKVLISSLINGASSQEYSKRLKPDLNSEEVVRSIAELTGGLINNKELANLADRLQTIKQASNQPVDIARELNVNLLDSLDSIDLTKVILCDSRINKICCSTCSKLETTSIKTRRSILSANIDRCSLQVLLTKKLLLFKSMSSNEARCL